MPSPTHYTWQEDEWHLDTTGPWVDDALEIGNDSLIENTLCFTHLFLL